jgi:hypothetical protein
MTATWHIPFVAVSSEMPSLTLKDASFLQRLEIREFPQSEDVASVAATGSKGFEKTANFRSGTETKVFDDYQRDVTVVDLFSD